MFLNSSIIIKMQKRDASYAIKNIYTKEPAEESISLKLEIYYLIYD